MTGDRRALRRHLFALAAAQGGYFSAAQAKDAGYSYQAQAHHVNAGNWLRVSRGLFRLSDWVPDLHDDLIRWSLWANGRGVVSHETALAVHGIGEFESPRVHLTLPNRTAQRDEAVVLHIAELSDVDVQHDAGFRVTTVQRSLIDVAASTPDNDQLTRAIDEAITRGHVTTGRLRRRAEEIDLKAALHIERALHQLEIS